MKKIVIALFLGDMVALFTLALIDHIYQIEGLVFITQSASASLIGLAPVACCLGDLEEMLRSIGKNICHPALDGIIIAFAGTTVAIGTLWFLQNPFAPAMAIPVGLVSLETAWQFGHQQRRRRKNIRIRDWNRYR